MPQAIMAKFQGGLNLEFFKIPVPGSLEAVNPKEQAALESLKTADPKEHAAITARNALRLLLMGWSPSWRELLTKPLLKAVFWERDPQFTKELRLALQQGFVRVFDQLRKSELNAEQREQVQLYLSNCLSILPFGDLTPYESIDIPQYINGAWELVEYGVTPIELTPTSGLQRLFIQDKDRVFAYGLDPLTDKNAQSHLIFMGTTYLAGQGFFPQFSTDLKGFETPGDSLYSSGLKHIEAWLFKPREQKVHVCGVSLGGSLSLLLALHHGKYIQRVDALNPPGLHNGWQKGQYDHWETLVDSEKPQVVVQWQEEDPVAYFGIWKEDWQLVQVHPPKDKKAPNPFLAHILNYAAFAGTQFTTVSAKDENAKRTQRNFWLYSLGRSVLYYLAVVPYTYLIRPLLHFVVHHWLKLALSMAFLVGLSVLGVPVVAALSLPLLAGVASALVGAFCLLRNLMSSQDEAYAQLHDPDLPRNPSMDLYSEQNSVEVTLTYKAVNTYYDVMRRLVKGKEFLPAPTEHESESKKTKRQLLEESLKPENQEKTVSLKKTRAKAAHMQRVLTFVDKIGSKNLEQMGREDKKKLSEAAQADYDHYVVGKPDPFARPL